MAPALRTAADLCALIVADPWRLGVLRTVRSLGLPDWAIGAGFVRNPVWDALHGRSQPTPLPDVDVLFFDPVDISRDRETELESRLGGLMAEVPWSVKNQARMHLRIDDKPYRDTTDAIRHWLETSTALAIRLTASGKPELLAPFDTDDLLTMIARPTPSGERKPEQYGERIISKRFPERWPQAQVIWPKGRLQKESN